MRIRGVFNQLNVVGACRKYGIPLWQCPQFLFAIMGLIILISGFSFYGIGTRYVQEPEIVTLIVMVLTGVLFVIAFIISASLEKLAEASRMKSEFINIISHQLRSPLTNLKWTLELLNSERVSLGSEKQLEYLKVMKENLDRMTELIQDLLIASKIETTRLPMVKKEISLEDLANGLISKFTPFARASNVELSFQNQPDLPKVFGDASWLKIVIENLLDNAIKYIKVGGKVEMRLFKRSGKVFFEIKDNGVGIPKEDQKYIFQKFFRSANALKQQTQGSGLGLYISKAIIKESGGEIGFKSEENKGSIFWFSLPLK